MEGPEVPLEEVQALSVLEKAFREALATVPAERVLQRVLVMFPQVPVEIDVAVPHSRVQKVSVSMPEDLVTAIRERTGAGGFSRYITEAGGEARDERLGELSAWLEEQYGPVLKN